LCAGLLLIKNSKIGDEMQKPVLFISGLAFFLISCIGSFYFHFNHHPKTEKRFLSSIESAFENGENIVFIRDVTPFQWDKVCYLGPHSKNKKTSIHRLQTFIDADITEHFDEIPNLSEGGTYKGSFVFISDGLITNILNLKTTYLKVNGEYVVFRFPSDRNYKRTCMDNDKAHMKYEHFLKTNSTAVIINDQL
jgi:hypothetical protein